MTGKPSMENFISTLDILPSILENVKVHCWMPTIPFLDKSIPCIVLWKSKYGNRYYCLNRNTFSIFRKVVPQKEKEKTKFGKQVLFPNRDIL